ncbi:hypothetical protein B0E53_00286 [Micromonospora sp. MH33]|uniref:DUF7824 domain-containing protein n=1 Tax=Micromonospora sp. MH33 TaxID=1945509 RepID=UPI000D14B64D|nr:DUF6493 family protein [Micromonospora sp. MH33]PSK67815.1 hypothetical protein B0E53_00286 [Micromonospora sp. MH33]
MSGPLTYDIPHGATEGMRELLHVVREGRAEAVPELVGTLTAAERRTCLPVLKSWRATTRNNRDDGHWAIRAALLLAGAGCCTGTAAAAQWLASGDLRWASRDPSPVLEALGDRDPEWLGQLAHRLAERRTVAEEEYPLIAQLVHAAGCEPPTTDGFVLGWERSIPVRGMTVKDRLRDDPFLAVMVPRLFEVPEAGSDFQYSRADDPGWPEALAGLAEEGRLSREMLIDGCLSRLLRGGRLGLVKGFLALLTALDLTEDERAAHTLTWVRMVPDAHALAVARAQEVLAGLDEAGCLESEHLVEASRAALFRPEKKIVRAQLTMLDKAMKRGGARTDELLPAAAVAFSHAEHSLQEQALALVVRHREHATGAVLAGLAASAEQLSPDLRKRAAEVFGHAFADEGAGALAVEGDALPPVPSAERLDPAPLTSAELAEEVGVLLRGGGTPAQWERALNGLVVHAHADLAGLRAALEPVVAQLRQPASGDGGYGAAVVGGWNWLYCVVMSVMGTASEKDLTFIRYRALDHQCPHSAIRSVPLIRAAEIGARLSDSPLPFLLATPTWSTGTIEASELVARLAAYERSGTEPGHADLDQALLRLDREVPPEAVAAAAKLTSPAGRRLAARLASGGLPDPAVSRDTEPLSRRAPRPGVLVRTEAVPGHEDYPEPFRSLLGVHDPIGSPCKCGSGGECSPQALALLPQHREIIAGRMLVSFANLAEFDNVGEVAPVLLALAESGGPAGPATHLLLAYGLGARRVEEQLFAVDAMLILAARGQLDAARLGRDIAELAGLRRLKLQRIVVALQGVARTSAYATVWAVLSAALPLLLAGEAPHGLPAVLTIAAECAERCGARGTIPEINELAARSGPSQLVKQARRIKSATEMPVKGQ